MMKEAGFTGLDFTVDLMDDFDEVVMGPGAMKKAAEIRDLTADVGPFNYEITTWYRTFSDALLPEALALSVKAAAPMMRIIEGKE